MLSGPQGEPISLSRFIEQSANAALALQRDDGSFPPGQNAHYGDNQTPVRTTAHWLFLLTRVAEMTDETRYYEAAQAAAVYLTSTESRPYSKTFYCLRSQKKSRCNGVVGQAIPVWSLSMTADPIDYPEGETVAEDVASIHPFDERLRLWNPVNIDGTVLPFDRTLNHQLAFAAALSTLRGDGAISGKPVQRFLDSLEKIAAVRPNGLIRHLACTPPLYIPRQDNWRNLPTSTRNRLLFEFYRYSSSVKEKEVGYQSVNLLWFACLKQNRPDHAFWRSEMMHQALEFIVTDTYREAVFQNEMGFLNTPTGLHIAVALETFDRQVPLSNKDREDRVKWWVETQLASSFDFSTGMMKKRASDPELMASTIWKATLIDDLQLFDERSLAEVVDRIYQ